MIIWEIAQDIAIEIDRDVEIVDLMNASTVFRYQVLTTGTRIYCSDEKHADLIETGYLSMYLRFNEERAEILKDYS